MVYSFSENTCCFPPMKAHSGRPHGPPHGWGWALGTALSLLSSVAFPWYLWNTTHWWLWHIVQSQNYKTNKLRKYSNTEFWEITGSGAELPPNFCLFVFIVPIADERTMVKSDFEHNILLLVSVTSQQCGNNTASNQSTESLAPCGLFGPKVTTCLSPFSTPTNLIRGLLGFNVVSLF